MACRASGSSDENLDACLCPEFNMHRMVMQDADDLQLQASDAAHARNLAAWCTRVESAWPRLQVRSVSNCQGEVNLGNKIQISAQVFLDCLKPEDVSVQIISGNVGVNGEIKDPEIMVMNTYETEGAGCYRFRG